SRKIITNTRPAMPAMTPFRSESLPSEAETRFCEYGENFTGSVPDWISSAIRLASAVVRPVIWLPGLTGSSAAMPSGNAWGLMVGAATSWLSTTIAFGSGRPARRPAWEIWRVMLWKSLPPPFLYCSATIGLPFWSVVAEALEISLPVTISWSSFGRWNRYQTVGGDFVVASGQPFCTSQLTAASPAGTARQTVPGGWVRRWRSFSTWPLRGSMRDRMPPRLTRLCVFALKSAQPAGVTPFFRVGWAAVSIE